MLRVALLLVLLAAHCAHAESAFDWRVPEGNYRVTIHFPTLGSAERATVTAESRRLMLQPASKITRAERIFVVNVRTSALPAPPENAPGSRGVRMGTKELVSASWDNRLTIRVLDAPISRDNISVEPANVPTIYLAGDSTVTDQPDAPAASWGQMLPRFFRDDIAVANHAVSGASLKSFLIESRLEKILSTLHEGDWLLIQFGHNDQKPQWLQTYADADTTFRDYLRVYIAEARRKGATPILITPPERRNFKNGKIEPSLAEYASAIRNVAKQQGVALIDLNAASIRFYEALGETRAASAFSESGKDRTHHNEYGAYELARAVIEGVRSADATLASHLATDLKRFDPGRPDAPEGFSINGRP